MQTSRVFHSEVQSLQKHKQSAACEFQIAKINASDIDVPSQFVSCDVLVP